MSRIGLMIIITVLLFSCNRIKTGTTCIIEINADSVLFVTNSHIIGVNRNHISHNRNTTLKSKYISKRSNSIENELLAYNNVRPTFAIKRKLYRLGHGPTDGRLDPPNDFMKGYHFEDWWDKTAYPYDDIRFGLQEAALLNADVTMVVNYGTGTPDETGRMVSYLNNMNDLLRNSQGDKPWNVVYFELGNEVTWKNQRGHDPYCLSASDYATRANKFIIKMRKNSDIPIKIGVVASINGSFINDDWSNDESDNCMHDINTLIKIMDDDIDFIVYHNYPSLGSGLGQIMAQNTWLQNKIDQKISPTIKRATKKYGLTHPIRLANSEFNTGRYGKIRQPDVLEALYAADNIITAIKNNMEMAVSFCFSSNGFQGMMFFNNDTLIPTPVFQMQKLLADHLGDSVIFCKSANIPSFTVDSLVTTQVTDYTVLTSLEVPDNMVIDNLAFICTKKADGKLELMVLNRTERSQNFKMEIQGHIEYSNVEMYLLKGEKYSTKKFSFEKRWGRVV